jgi:50S ribosomal subunit-associated GTPase HflX
MLVADATAAWGEEEQAVIGELETARGSRPPLAVYNKCDLGEVPNDWRPAGVAVSALTGQGVEQLLGEIAARLVSSPPPAGAAVPFTQRQTLLLNEALTALDRGVAAAAHDLLVRLAG